MWLPADVRRCARHASELCEGRLGPAAAARAASLRCVDTGRAHTSARLAAPRAPAARAGRCGCCGQCCKPLLAAAAHLLVYERRDGQAVEAVCEGPPEPDVVAPLALVVEAVDAVDGGALVVAAQQEEVLGVLDLRAAMRWRVTAGRQGRRLQRGRRRAPGRAPGSSRGRPQAQRRRGPGAGQATPPGGLTLKASSRQIVSRLCLPRST
jgi:hypothetical protein